MFRVVDKYYDVLFFGTQDECIQYIIDNKLTDVWVETYR